MDEVTAELEAKEIQIVQLKDDLDILQQEKRALETRNSTLEVLINFPSLE